MKSKALLLLFIFLLNTVTGFACALRMAGHEHEEATAQHHEGNEGAEHHHERHQQVFQRSNHLQLILNGTYVSEDDLCCQGAVNSFNALAKVVPQTSHVILLAPFTWIGTNYQFLLKPVSVNHVNQLLPLDERRRPPTHPIRIIIQSFQI